MPLSVQHEAAVAAVVYEKYQGDHADRLLADIASRLRREGARLAGVVQHNELHPERHRCDMTLCDLSSGRLIRITQNLGRDSQGCRLDTAALEDAAGLVETAVRAGADMLVLNRFGKREAEGRGLSGALALAIDRDIPVLVGLNRTNEDSWDAFTGSLALSLPPDGDSVLAWCRRMLRCSARRHPATGLSLMAV
ncbi:hypothetical protein BLTE_10200 [Blastochloris tepida]|uniref:Molybdenum ABC transporter ATP-binding protein n=1 Tax=Blastochloris tepida TaxID=2233851 RepID=A0A348FYF2_9HYPH|nr:hypothetical protein BLTE_10200 [Blastochloris tepida]